MQTFYTILAVIAVIFILYALVEPYLLKIIRLDIVHPDVPVGFDGMSIAFLTDFHVGSAVSAWRLERAIGWVEKENPDLVLLGGDYVGRLRKRGMRRCFSLLRKLDAWYGVYGVLGNHDVRRGDKDAVLKELHRAGVVPLDNEAVWLSHDKERIRLGGVSDYRHDVPDLAPTLEGSGKSDFVILLAHNPDFIEDIDASSVDLIVSGHTHGGQITLFGRWAPFVSSRYGQKYRTGVRNVGGTDVVVSNGVGTNLLPFRFFARPEIHFLTLRKSGPDPA